ncbi:hypothetical protein M0R45_037271 [Rubus argutus]|uniref:Uncharacterized protein n=1 Tax=Rubus argutus TaxID=59490 RepID=A0AAW1VZR4_RUBAR
MVLEHHSWGFISEKMRDGKSVTITRLQAQAGGVPYSHPPSNITSRMAFLGRPRFSASTGAPDFVLLYGSAVGGFKEGFARLWRGTNAGLALAVPTVAF